MEILVYIVTLIYIVYNWESVRKNKGYPASLSATYYLWPKWVFPTVMSLIGFGLLPVWLEMTDSFLSFLACVGLIFVGISPDYRNDEQENKVHHGFAYLAAAAALLSLMFVLGTWWIFPIAVVIKYLLDIKEFKKHYLYHIEDALIISILLSII
jgi:hypothetical protein